MRTAIESFLLEEEPAEKRAEPATNQTMESFFAPKPLVVENGEPEMRSVARYGRIYKRKAPNYSKLEHSKIPCPPGERPFCLLQWRGLRLRAGRPPRVQAVHEGAAHGPVLHDGEAVRPFRMVFW